MKTVIQDVVKFLKSIFHKLDKLTGGILWILFRTFKRFGEERGSEAAASLAYYAFFSIFPMLLVFIVIASFFVDPSMIRTQLLDILQGTLPGAEIVIIQNIEQVLEERGQVTLIALVSLIWSATGVFNNLAKNINRAFLKADMPNFLTRRLLGFSMFLGLGLMMVLSLGASILFKVISDIEMNINGYLLQETFIWQIGYYLVPALISVLLFWAIYQWVPMIKVSRKASLLGGLFAGVSWELLNHGFSWYLSSEFSRYNLVYGSVGTVVALLFWIYLTSMIVLVGAHLTASLNSSFSQSNDAQ